MRFLKTICLLFVATSIFSQELKIIPKPVEIKRDNGSFLLTKEILIEHSISTKKEASFLHNYLKSYYGLDLQLTTSNKEKKNPYC